MIDGATKRTVSSGAVHLALVQAGDATRPTIVFVHGYPDTKEVWDGVLERLRARFHVVAYDVRGAGQSTAPRGPAAYGFERLADDLAAVIGEVSPQAPVHLVGHDWGGIAGWEQVAMPRLRGRIASFTSIAGPSLRQLSLGMREQIERGRLLEVADRLRRSWYVVALCTPAVPTLAWRGVLGRGGWRRYLQAVERVPGGTDHPAPTLTEDAIHGSNLYRRNILLQIGRRKPPPIVDVPVQLIVPSGDRFISETYYERAGDFAPGLRHHTVPGPHWLPRTQPELVARLVGSFVEEVQRAART